MPEAVDGPEELVSSRHSRAAAPVDSQWGRHRAQDLCQPSQIRSQDGVADEHKFLLLTVEL